MTTHAAERGDAAWFSEAKLGLFVHWMAFSAYGEDGVLDRHVNETYEQFRHLLGRFTLEAFDADAFVRRAQARGFRYLIPTSHHAEGFCLWDTRTSEFKTTNAPARRDLVAELAHACRRHGLRFGIYFPYCDLSHPLVQPLIPLGKGDSSGWGTGNPLGSDAALAAYRAHLQEQVRELCTNYGKLDLFWWDAGPPDLAWSSGIKDMVYRLQPGILQNSRWGTDHVAKSATGNGLAGDFFTPEQNIPPFPPTLAGNAVPFETCLTTINNWCYERTDRHYKSGRTLLRTFLDAISKGGNLLINLGPDTHGRVPPEVDAALDEMGAWLATHAAAVWDSAAGPRHDLPDVAMTRCEDTLNLYCHGRHRRLRVPGFGATLTAARTIAGAPVPFVDKGTRIELDLRGALEPLSTALRLTFDGEPRATTLPATIPAHAVARARWLSGAATPAASAWAGAAWTTVTAANGYAVYAPPPARRELYFRFAVLNNAARLFFRIEVALNLSGGEAVRRTATDLFAEAAGAKANEALTASSSVELYLDALPPAPEVTADRRCFQILVTAAGKAVLCFEPEGKPDKVEYASSVTRLATGYRVDVMLPFSSLLKDLDRQPAEYVLTNFFGLPRQDLPYSSRVMPVRPGDTLGLNVSVNARFPHADGALTQKLWWQARSHCPFNDPGQWGRLRLASRTR